MVDNTGLPSWSKFCCQIWFICGPQRRGDAKRHGALETELYRDFNLRLAVFRRLSGLSTVYPRDFLRIWGPEDPFTPRRSCSWAT